MARTKASVTKKVIKAEDGSTVQIKTKKRRYRPGTVAKREIVQYQIGKKATVKCIPKASVSRLIHEIVQEVNPEMRVQRSAKAALHEGKPNTCNLNKSSLML